MQSQQQPRIIDLLVLLIMGYTLAGCASSGANIMSDYDHDAPFGSYKTFNFMEGAGPENSSYQSFFSQYMVDAITIEMENRGYTKSDDPDLLLNFNAVLEDKTKVRTTSAPPPMHGGYYGYRGASYGAWGGYGYGTQTHVSQYTEGTFNIDIVDAKKHQLVRPMLFDERLPAGVKQSIQFIPLTQGLDPRRGMDKAKRTWERLS